jgi:hypothetical protein
MGVLPMYFGLPTTHPVSGWSSEEKEDTKAQFCYFSTTHPVSGWSSEEKEDTKAQFCYFCCRPFNILFLKKNSHDSS